MIAATATANKLICASVFNLVTEFLFLTYSFLTSILETGIVPFTFCTERISAFKVFTVSIDRES
ncbi:hypothetical protein MYD04_00445 [Mediterraneibacter gnavus]